MVGLEGFESPTHCLGMSGFIGDVLQRSPKLNAPFLWAARGAHYQSEHKFFSTELLWYNIHHAGLPA